MLWDIFCDIIDNHGDLGVTWRLARALADRGESVRLWLQGDPGALTWMAPHGHDNVQVLSWNGCPEQVAQNAKVPDVLIEAFGCAVPTEWLAHCAQSQVTFPFWLNLEYLSAEPYVERCHGLASPVMSGPAQGQKKWFFYPGFTPKTGGLMHRLTQTPPPLPNSTHQITLFCYEPPALPGWLDFLNQGGLSGNSHTTTLKVTPGRTSNAVRRAQAQVQVKSTPGHLSLEFLEPCSQTDFDQLLSQSDLNFVRGEDSLVSAIFANRPFVWQIYPQADGAHEAKLQAFLDWLEAPASLRQTHLWWNGLSSTSPSPAELKTWFAPDQLQEWSRVVSRAREKCLQQADLVEQILAFRLDHSGKNTLKS